MNRIPTWFLGLLVVALILGFTTVALADESKGAIKSVDADKMTVTVTVDGKDTTYTATKDTTITVAGKAAKFADLKPAAKVTVTFKKDGANIVVSAIDAN